jgi:hypothetical protein
MTRPVKRPDKKFGPKVEEGSTQNPLGPIGNQGTGPKKSLRPKARPEKTFELNTAEYDGREIYVIDFKDGKRMSSFDVLKMFDRTKTSPETKPGKKASQQIMNYLRENNPTKEEFIKHFSTVAANKGGLIKKKKSAYSKGGYVNCGASVKATQATRK